MTREELTKWYDCNLKSRTFHRDCEKCFLGELNLYNMWSCKYSRKNVADSHLAALDEIERLKAASINATTSVKNGINNVCAIKNVKVYGDMELRELKHFNKGGEKND